MWKTTCTQFSGEPSLSNPAASRRRNLIISVSSPSVNLMNNRMYAGITANCSLIVVYTWLRSVTFSQIIYIPPSIVSLIRSEGAAVIDNGWVYTSNHDIGLSIKESPCGPP